MFYQDLGHHIRNTSDEYDLLARITQHPGRPRPARDIDQIFMLPGSQLNQAKLISDYLRNRDVVFVGDGDCMSLVIGILAKNKVIQGPGRMRVFDFDERIVRFVKDASRQFGFADGIEAHRYNVRDPVPVEFAGRSEVFYTNPPYGSKNAGKSGIVFLARCMEFCRDISSYGVAILPFHHHTDWSRNAMFNIQKFLTDHGYVVSEMLRAMHGYHLDDEPNLLSGTIVVDRIHHFDSPYKGKAIPPLELAAFYGSQSSGRFAEGIDLEGTVRWNELHSS